MATNTLSKPATRAAEFWYTRCPVPTTSGLAHQLGFLSTSFAAEGVVVHSLLDSKDKATRRSHYDHSLPSSFREGGNVPSFWAKARGQDTVVIGISWVDEEQLILVKADSPILQLSDLKGKRLGIPRHTTSVVDFMRAQDQHGLVTALRLGGLGPKDATFVDVVGHDYEDRGPNGERREWPLEVADALAAGEVDAIYAKGVTSAELVASRGFRPLLDINAHPDPFVRVNTGTPRPITVDRAFVEANPEITARYLAVLLKTGAWARKHPDRVVEAVAAETYSRADHVRRGYGPELHEHFDITLSEQSVEGLRRQKDFLVEWGFIPADFDYDAWIVREPLRRAHEIIEKEGLDIG